MRTPALALALAIAAAALPAAIADTITGVYYVPDKDNVPAVSYTLALSATSSIRFATWELSDGSLTAVLCLKASHSVDVGVAVDLSGGSATKQNQLARQLRTAGATVYSCTFARQIKNNFLEADGNKTATGNYYWSPTAQQIGSYLLTVTGTATAAQAVATYGSLTASGTPLAVHRYKAHNPSPCSTPWAYSPTSPRPSPETPMYSMQGLIDEYVHHATVMASHHWVMLEQPRSPLWPEVRAAFLKTHPTCEATGTSHNLEVHHVLPFHDDPELELTPGNLITLRRDVHLLLGHLDDWTSYNPHVRADAAALLAAIRSRPH